MKNTTLMLGVLVALIVGGSVGYSFGKSANNNGDTTKELQDSIIMMKEQAISIQKMSELMKSGGAMMQEIGLKYTDDEAISKGKDLEMIGEKYRAKNAETSDDGGSMQHMMGN